jgi:hypothetical protein
MANNILTINMITREAVALWKNSNAFLQNVDQQYDDSYAISGAKIGQALRVRLPNDFSVRTGPAVSVQDTAEQSTSLVLAAQRGVDVAFSTQERTLSLDDYSERVLAPMINSLAGAVAADLITGTEGGVCNLVSNVDGGNNILNPTLQTYLAAGASLNLNSAPLGRRKIVNDPLSEVRIVGALAGLFNPVKDISKQYSTGMMGQAIGFDWLMDQTVIKHTTGSFTAGTVNGAGQTGLVVVMNAITGTLNAGDIVTFPGVFAVNRVTKQSTGQLRQFAVTANVPSGSTQIPIYPAIIPGGPGFVASSGVNNVQYQTVTASPANAAAMTLVTNPNSIYRKNIAYAPQAVTIATADLEMINAGVIECARESYDGVSMRMISAYTIGTDQAITRLDVLYGFLYIRPEWCCIVADAL